VKLIRWEMIGCGDVAEVKSGPGFYKARDSELVAVSGIAFCADAPQLREFCGIRLGAVMHSSADESQGASSITV